MYKCFQKFIQAIVEEQSAVHAKMITRDLLHNVLSILNLIYGSLYYQIIKQTLNFLGSNF